MAPSVGVAAFGVGLDAAYSWRRELALGLQHLEYGADQGADPHYCERCIRSGRTTLAFVEGRLFAKALATPYGRLGLGLSHLSGQRVSNEEGYSEFAPTLSGEVGIELHYRWASLRLFGFHWAPLGSELDSDPLMGFGVQLGVRL